MTCARSSDTVLQIMMNADLTCVFWTGETIEGLMKTKQGYDYEILKHFKTFAMT